MRMSQDLSEQTLAKIETGARARYATFTRGLPFHGWHHVEFVRARARGLAQKNGADVTIVEAAAIVHDLNYMVERNSLASTGRELRHELLTAAGVPGALTDRIDHIVYE